ncbi:MAG: DUF1045 domain-containing protein [Roseobacter sp.]
MFQRYAIYYTPAGGLAEVGASWLGWDLRIGIEVPHPVIDGLKVAALTRRPHKYGFHGTIKPPFALAAGTTEAMLTKEFEALCTQLVPVTLGALEIKTIAHFIALVPVGDQTELARLAAEVVKDLDHFRAPSSEGELARRRQANLTPSQNKNLTTWGYPYVMEDFRFHITLTGRIKGDMPTVAARLREHFAPYIQKPFHVDTLTLTGQDDEGMFHEIQRFPLQG